MNKCPIQYQDISVKDMFHATQNHGLRKQMQPPNGCGLRADRTHPDTGKGTTNRQKGTCIYERKCISR